MSSDRLFDPARLASWLARNERALRWPIVIFALLEVAAYYLPGLLKQAVFSNDMAQWTAWAYRYQDQGLFPGDPNAAYWTASFPLGYAAMLRLLAPLVDPQVLGETVGMALGGVTAWLSYRLGHLVCGGRLSGGVAALLLIFAGQFTHFQALNLLNFEAGGLPRGFALPLLLLGYLGIAERRFWQFAAAVVLAGLFYPPAVVSLGAIAGLLALCRIAQVRAVKLKTIQPLLFVAAGLAIAQANVLLQGSVLGRQFAWNEIVQMPEFRGSGILPLFYADTWTYFGNAVMLDKGAAGIAWFLFTAVALVVMCKRGDAGIARMLILIVPASALTNYALAYLLLPRMYEPSRYFVFAYPMLTIITVSYAFDTAARRLANRLTGPTLALPRAWPAIAVGLAVGLNVADFAVRYRFDRGGMNDTMPAEMYRYIETLPKTAVIGGMPTLTDRIPMRARRSVLIMSTSFYPYHAGFYQANLAKFDGLIGALAAPDAAPAAALRDRFGVHYLVVDLRAPLSDALTVYEPLHSRIARLGDPSQGTSGFVARQARDHALFRAGPYALIALDGIGQ